MDIQKLLDSLNIEGLTDELKGQLQFLNDYSKDLDVSQIEEIQDNIKSFNDSLSKLKNL